MSPAGSDRQFVLVTGASSGIGAALAVEFAAAGYDLLLAARRLDKLTALATALREAHGVEAEAIAADLSSAAGVDALVRAIGARGRPVDVLVNNAGFGHNGSIAEIDPERQRHMLRLNVEALAGLTRALVPGMVERGRGGVLNVASTAAFQPGPFFGTYAATKAFVLSFSEALSEELRGSGVQVSCLCPGATATEFAAEAEMENSPVFTMFPVSDAASVARAAVRGYQRGKVLIVPGLSNRLGTITPRLLPRAFVRRTLGKLFRRGLS